MESKTLGVFFTLASLMGFACDQARADLEQYPVRSLEWLVDTSDVIVVATVEGPREREKLCVDRWLKPVNRGADVLAPSEIDNLECTTCTPFSKFQPARESGDRLLLFARVDDDHQSRVHFLVYLQKAAVRPPPSGSYQEACRVIYQRATLALYDSEGEAERMCAVINMHGEILVDPEFVLETVEQRVAAGPTVPPDAEVAKLERFFQVEAATAYGGFYVGGLVLDDFVPWADSGGNDVHLILVPPEPKFQSAAFAALRERYQHLVYARPALHRLANYPHDPQAIEWLETYLREGHPERVETSVVNGTRQSDLLRAEVQQTIDLLRGRHAASHRGEQAPH